MASATSLYPSTSLLPFSSSDSSSSYYVPRPLSISANWIPISCLHDYSNTTYFKHLIRNPLFSNSRNPRVTCWAAEYKFPDPIPEFAEAETEKFRAHLLNKLSKKDIFGDSVQEVVGICTEILSTFLHTEYGGPGTLLVIPFMDMADTLNERGLPGGPQAARAAVKWAQNHVDKDWKEWTSKNSR
ncbi:protein PLASTID REDOX INSENSITIVE 2, chloroplastic-like [Coffea eugenioides]|uniref:Protein PLASTID REDOX INSENSITIVE 2, chloroplastic n=1 Tax=Coffea arabica TaxID=13443 RepID=A0A6P6V7E3_COFAR|nr:protein PLASTID REDOX INSENSITIVE 2, chloroplastic-like [Coffea arabica]XP_027153129.1 protein PLASTID REDOX INSENSITIVE 2, chloroplastic-like [Coffea eugenioides]